LFAFTAALNPTLLAAVTVMLLLDRPKRLLVGYLLGAAITSVTLGLVIVYSLRGSGVVGTAQNSVNPGIDLAFGAIALLIAYVLGTEKDVRLRERRQRHAKKDKGPPMWQRALGRGSPRITFVVGAALTLPGASYIAGLTRIAKQDYTTPETVAVVLLFNVIMLALLELPLIGYVVAPEWTPAAIQRFRSWLSRSGRRVAVRGATIIGTLLVIRALIVLLT
jgi:hypothetical protein